jgi:Fe(3+) dicitrate transport protein
MKHIPFTFLLTFLFLSGASAQSAAITGKVLMSDSITVVTGANIYLENLEFGATSNGNGNFLLGNVSEGLHQLTVSYMGAQTIRQDIHLAPSDTLNLTFYLTESVSLLGEVVVMTRGNTGLRDIPGSAHYISPKEIEKFTYTDINRTLRAVPGINLQEEDGFGLRPNIGLRGTGVERSSKITIMEDGVLMAPAPYADPAAYYFPTVGRMQGVEVLKGSSQIKYGPFTTGGAINFISAQLPEEFSGRITLLGGSYGGRNLHAQAGNAHEHLAYMAEAYQYGSNGFKELDGGGSTGFDKKDYLAKIRVNTSQDAQVYQSLTFKIGQAKETSNETYLGLTEEDFAATPMRRYAGSQMDLMQTEHDQLSLTHFIRLSNAFQITTTAYRANFSRNWYKLDSVTDSTGRKTSIGNLLENPSLYGDAYAIITGETSLHTNALTVRANNRSYASRGLQTVVDYGFKTKSVSHDIQLGIRYHQDEVDRFQWDDFYSMHTGIMQLTQSGTPGTESNLIKSAEALASYVQYKLKFRKFTAVPGLRYEDITLKEINYGKADPDRIGTEAKESQNHVGVFIPGFGLDYQHSKYLSAFAGIHKGFSPPGVKDETLPEESINYETGIRYTKNALSGQVVFFYNHYSNLLGSDLAASGGSGTGDLFNAGEVNSSGVEFQLGFDLLAGQQQHAFSLPVSIVYTFTNAVFQNSFVSTFDDWGSVEAGDQFPYLAHNQFTILLGVEHRKFGFNISGRYMDEMRTKPGQGAIPSNEKTDAYFVVDASAYYNLHKHFSLFANATNLTNDVYVVARRPAGLRPGMPIAFNGGIKATF